MRIITAEDRPRPRGYSDAVAAQGELLFISGQVGWNQRGEIVSQDFAEQSAQALRNVVALLRAAGARPEQIVRMTWYVTDVREYRAAAKRLGVHYREIVGTHYPAMTLVQVAALLEEGAKIEIEATAVV